MTPKYEDIIVDLVGQDSNAMMIIGRVRKAMRRGGVSSEEIKLFSDEATSGDYDNVLITCMKWVDVR